MIDYRARSVLAVLTAICIQTYVGHAFVVSGFRLTPDRASGDTFQADKNQPPPKKDPYQKLAQPWPTPEARRERRLEAEARRLFASEDPLVFTLAADFKAVNKDHNPKSTQRFPAELRIARGNGQIDVIHVQLSARGHLRRMARTCDFVPLRLEFPKEGVKDTLFEGPSALKLVVQCDSDAAYQQYLLREYLGYRIFNLLTPRSFRVRLATVTYVNVVTNKAIATRPAMFLEDDSDVARRMEGRAVGLPRVLFRDVDPDTLNLMMVFQYMIGNTDFSIVALHNVVLVQTPDRRLYPVPYDFDISGLVRPPYAIPARRLVIKSVVDRLYRGPCLTLEQVEPILADFIAKQDKVMALADSVPGLEKQDRGEVNDYLAEFYSIVKNRREVRRTFVEGCSKDPGM